jgi:uncharacterized protein YqjF (DUF2071 family)
MPSRVADMDRISPTRRPPGLAVGYHTWRDLTFLHWRFPPELISPLLPPGLSLDTFEGDAWVGLVPFYMANVRPRWFCAVPGLSHFCETNVRTYVHFQGANPGVWFLSLEASNSIAVNASRSRRLDPQIRLPAPVACSPRSGLPGHRKFRLAFGRG